MIALAGITNFVHGDRYQQFKDKRMHVRHDVKHLGVDWLGCDVNVTHLTPRSDENQHVITDAMNSGADVSAAGVTCTVMTLVAIRLITMVTSL